MTAAYESIYLRPRVGRSDNQLARNHTVQYYAYPDYKFDRLRKESPGMYETTAPVDINEWITMRIEVNGRKGLHVHQRCEIFNICCRENERKNHTRFHCLVG